MMLANLKVRDLVLIEDVSLDFAAGMNVLTGETGAGKSILLDALGLAAGSRAGGRSSVRSGASQGSAVAFVNDESIGVGLLRELGTVLVEIHGQADDRGLFDPSTHRKLLDAFGGHEE